MLSSYKEIWRMACPILFSLLMQQLIGLTDTAFLGRVGEVELGAAALGSVYFLAVFMLGFGFSLGAQILIGRRNGEGHCRQIGRIFYSGVLFLVFLATFCFFTSRGLSPLILRPLIKSDAVYQATIDYLDWRSFGFFFVFITVMFRAFFVGITQTRILTVNSLIMVLSNVLFNYALIFGKFGFPVMGIAGAAIASSISELVSVIFYITYTRYRIDLDRYGLNRICSFRFKILQKVLSISIWTMLQSFISISTWFIFFIAVEHLGERQLATINVVRNVAALVFIVINAFSTTASSLVSNLIGAGQADQVMKLGWRVIGVSFLIITPLLLLIVIFPEAILNIYTDNPELIAAAVSTLLMMAAIQLLQTVGGIWFNIVSGTGNTRIALYIELASLALYLASVYYLVFYLRSNAMICWTTEFFYCIVMLIGSYWYMKKANWRAKQI